MFLGELNNVLCGPKHFKVLCTLKCFGPQRLRIRNAGLAKHYHFLDV